MANNNTAKLADRYFQDCENDNRKPEDRTNLRAWLWFTCPAQRRAEVEAEIRKRLPARRAGRPTDETRKSYQVTLRPSVVAQVVAAEPGMSRSAAIERLILEALESRRST